MSKPRIQSVDVVPRARRQRSVADAWPRDASGYHTQPPTTTTRPIPTSSDGIGRFPTIGIDTGHIPGTRPDQSSITNR